MKRKTNEETDRRSDRQMKIQTDKEKNIKMKRKTDEETDR
jgi:hypothetical protein